MFVGRIVQVAEVFGESVGKELDRLNVPTGTRSMLAKAFDSALLSTQKTLNSRTADGVVRDLRPKVAKWLKLQS